ncbi:hypothetical protein JX265_007537 [Neoarthrinium moseri]|uniref:Conserved oligomeric Golgi complex subunit 1 n=1 Tax=Neoarthrinium moseri TaxID=1658444 RepID=A0A9P9WJN0_9PEZI|nr:hypothetical protein JX265_007537 [Neoarthrinium moseri]
MAAPDTSNLTTSSQVFETYTLPQIRAIHKSLHVQIDEKAARLRTQVGNSYRELLGTADTIVQMRQDMSNVQHSLGRMGGMCGRTVVEGKVTGLGRFRGREAVETEMGEVARVKLLEASALAVARLLRGGKEGRGERLVLAAKVLVLIRLLIASFGTLTTVDHSLRVSIEAAKKTQRALKSRLLRGIGKILDNISSEVQQSDILKALCAYSLTENYGAKDVLQHFLRVRAEAMVLEFDIEEHERDRGTANVLRGLDLYTRTLLDVQALVPSKLADALASLKKIPLLADESLRTLEGVRLDVYERWCGEDIQYFTPFIRHDDLDGKQAKSMLTNWAKKGGETLLEGLTKTLGHVTEFKAIVDLRTSVLQHWIRDGGKARGFDPSVMLDGLRSSINTRLLDVIDTKVSKLRLVGSEVAATLGTWQSATSGVYQSLWDEQMLEIDVASGAPQVTHEVLSRLYGKNDVVSRAVTSYESWYHLIDDVGEVVEQLRRQRWDNDVEEIEDEETIEARQELLSKNDPKAIEAQLNKALSKAYQSLDEQVSEVWAQHKEGANNGEIAMYLLRVVRSIRGQLPKHETVKAFGLNSVSSLHESIVAHVVAAPLEQFTSSALTKTKVTGRGLWEGEPALPSQPSPGSFRLLRNLVTSMSDAGLDLWSPAAVALLKQTFGARLSDAWRSKLEATAKPQDVNTSSDGADDDDEDGAEQKAEEEVKPNSTESDGNKDLLVQWLYDIYLLQVYLGTPQDANESCAKLAEEVFEKTSLQKGAKERMIKTSQDYWKRTSLLFGLLA